MSNLFINLLPREMFFYEQEVLKKDGPKIYCKKLSEGKRNIGLL